MGVAASGGVELLVSIKRVPTAVPRAAAGHGLAPTINGRYGPGRFDDIDTIDIRLALLLFLTHKRTIEQ
jgi:hypothetical protein